MRCCRSSGRLGGRGSILCGRWPLWRRGRPEEETLWPRGVRRSCDSRSPMIHPSPQRRGEGPTIHSRRSASVRQGAVKVGDAANIVAAASLNHANPVRDRARPHGRLGCAGHRGHDRGTAARPLAMATATADPFNADHECGPPFRAGQLLCGKPGYRANVLKAHMSMYPHLGERPWVW
jgi:hypothetical protein